MGQYYVDSRKEHHWTSHRKKFRNRQNKKNNIIAVGLPKSKATESEQKKEENVNWIVSLFNHICEEHQVMKLSFRKTKNNHY